MTLGRKGLTDSLPPYSRNTATGRQGCVKITSNMLLCISLHSKEIHSRHMCVPPYLHRHWWLQMSITGSWPEIPRRH
ncbi:unnamed protein product, partial [Staurois parvus]